MKRIHLLILFLLFSFSFVLPISAQNQAIANLVYVLNGDIVTSEGNIIADGEPFDPLYMTPDLPTYYRPLVTSINPHVFFQNLFDDNLYSVPLSGGDIMQFTEQELATGFQVAFSPDGQYMLFPVRANDFQSIELWKSSLTDSNMEKLISFTIETGCGGGPGFPDENAYGMQGSPLLLFWYSDELVFASTNCLGEGIQKIDLVTGEVNIIDPLMHNVKINPSHTIFAGIAENALRLIDFNGNPMQVYTPTDGSQLDQLSWLPDGRLLISTVEERDPIPFNPVDLEMANDLLFGIIPESIPLYTTSLYVFTPETGEVNELWQMKGWHGLPVITATADTVYFSAIPDMEAMVTALNEGKEFADVVAVRPSSSIYMNSLEGDTTPILLIKGGEYPTLVNS